MMRSAFDDGERLRVGVGDDEVDAHEARGDHVVDGVAAGAADAEHGDPRLQLPDVGHFQIDASCAASSLGADSVADAAGLLPVRRTGSHRRSRFVLRAPSEAFPKPSSDAGEIAARPCSPRCRVRRGSKCSRCGELRIDEQPGRDREGRAFRCPPAARRCRAAGRAATGGSRMRRREFREAGELAGAAGEDDAAARLGRRTARRASGRAPFREFPRRAA